MSITVVLPSVALPKKVKPTGSGIGKRKLTAATMKKYKKIRVSIDGTERFVSTGIIAGTVKLVIPDNAICKGEKR